MIDVRVNETVKLAGRVWTLRRRTQAARMHDTRMSLNDMEASNLSTSLVLADPQVGVSALFAQLNDTQFVRPNYIEQPRARRAI